MAAEGGHRPTTLMSAYRFCRSDDIALLVDALNRCWAPYFPDEPPLTPAAFKRSIRDLQVWCSSCMVAFSGSDPIGVLIGAKRPSGTLVHKIAVHPDHRRQGHGCHLLASLASKLAILGPPRIIAEVPEALAAACGLFSASGYVQEALLTDYVSPCDENEAPFDDHEGRFVIRSRSTISPRMVSWMRHIRSAGSAPPNPSRQGRTTSQDLPSPPTSESRPTCFTSPKPWRRRTLTWRLCRSARSSRTVEPL